MRSAAFNPAHVRAGADLCCLELEASKLSGAGAAPDRSNQLLQDDRLRLDRMCS